MVVDELHQHETEIVLEEKSDSEPEEKKESLYEFDSSDEASYTADVESEVMEF